MKKWKLQTTAILLGGGLALSTPASALAEIQNSTIAKTEQKEEEKEESEAEPESESESKPEEEKKEEESEPESEPEEEPEKTHPSEARIQEIIQWIDALPEGSDENFDMIQKRYDEI